MANTNNGRRISQQPAESERCTVKASQHLSPEQLAEREHVPVTTVYQWRSKRTGPPGFKVGRHVRYRLADVIAWEEQQIAAERGGAA